MLGRVSNFFWLNRMGHEFFKNFVGYFPDPVSQGFGPPRDLGPPGFGPPPGEIPSDLALPGRDP